MLATVAITGTPELTGGAVWLAGWLGWAVLGAARSPEPGSSLLAIGCFAAIGFASYALAITGTSNDIALSLGIAGAFSLAMAATTAVSGGVGGLTGRLTLLFFEPNQMARAAAITMVAFFALLVGEIIADRRREILLTAGAATIATLAALVLTQSRIGVVAGAVGTVVVLAAHLSRRASLIVIVAFGVLAGIGGVAVLSDSAGESVSQSLSRSTDQPTNELRTLNGRTVLWPEVVDVALERPSTGVGLGRDRTVVSRFRAEGRVAWDAEHTHSLPLQVWLTTGLPGLVAVLGALVWLALRTWSAPDSVERTLTLGTLAVVMVDGIAEPTLRVPAFAWIVLTAGMGFVALEKTGLTGGKTTT